MKKECECEKPNHDCWIIKGSWKDYTVVQPFCFDCYGNIGSEISFDEFEEMAPDYCRAMDIKNKLKKFDGIVDELRTMFYDEANDLNLKKTVVKNQASMIDSIHPKINFKKANLVDLLNDVFNLLGHMQIDGLECHKSACLTLKKRFEDIMEKMNGDKS